MPEELAACAEYLNRQIEALNPSVIITLGRFSMAKFLPFVKISEAHGRPVKVNGRLIVPMYHPAAALHQPSLKPALEKDFLQLPELIRSDAPKGEETPRPMVQTPGTDFSTEAEDQSSAEQLSLFLIWKEVLDEHKRGFP